MMLVVAIGLVHGLVVIPVMFYLISLLPTSFPAVTFFTTSISSLSSSSTSQKPNDLKSIVEQLDNNITENSSSCSPQTLITSSVYNSKNQNFTTPNLFTNSMSNGILTIQLKPHY